MSGLYLKRPYWEEAQATQRSEVQPLEEAILGGSPSHTERPSVGVLAPVLARSGLQIVPTQTSYM